jgi:hypothetical protein
MARSKSTARPVQLAAAPRGRAVRIEEECLELDVVTTREIGLLRRLMGRVNGPAYPQPYLVEGPPGHFRLYVGDSAERVRTQHGML